MRRPLRLHGNGAVLAVDAQRPGVGAVLRPGAGAGARDLPAREVVAGLGRGAERDGVGRAVVQRALRGTAVCVICNGIEIRGPVRGEVQVAMNVGHARGCASAGRDGDARRRRAAVGAGPAGERVAALGRVVQREGCRLNGVARLVRHAAGERTAVEVVADRVGDRRPVRGEGQGSVDVRKARRRARTGRDLDGRLRRCAVGTGPAGEVVARPGRVVQCEGCRLNGVR